ncbi:MAG: lactate utilization protein [Thermodesulfobacteriota bacterium]
MQEFEKVMHRRQISKILDALKKKKYDPYFFETRKEARDFIPTLILPEETVGVGGSVTLRNELGVVELLKARGNTVYDHWDTGQDKKKRAEIKAKHRGADVFLSSLNAITVDGVIVNLDGGGNRVGALCSGPGKVIVVAGTNKIVDSLDQAVHRTRNHAAILNAISKERKLPCVETGICSDCSAPERMCAALLILLKRPNDIAKFTVVLINEELGF